MTNSLHVRLFDCLRAISGNQVLDGQELPCNNYGVKWQLATQEGICLLAAPSCSAGVRGHRLFRKSPFLKHPETGGGPDSAVYLNSTGKMGKIKPAHTLGERNYSFLALFVLYMQHCTWHWFINIISQCGDLRTFSLLFQTFYIKPFHLILYSSSYWIWGIHLKVPLWVLVAG